MKQKDIDIVIEILERQLGRKPSDDEIKDMSNLLSVQVKNVKKTKKTLEALKEYPVPEMFSSLPPIGVSRLAMDKSSFCR